MRFTIGFVVLLCWLSCVNAQVANDGCVFVNTTLGVSYDLTRLHSNTTDLEAVDVPYFYYLNPCSRVLNAGCLQGNPNAAVCQKDLSTGNKTWTELAEYRNATQSHTTEIWDPANIGDGLVFTYNNAPCNGTQNYTTRVIYACNRTIGNTSVSVTRPATCRVDLMIYSPVACGIVFGNSSSSSTGGYFNSSSSSSSRPYNSSTSILSSSSSPNTTSSSAISSSSSPTNSSTAIWSSSGPTGALSSSGAPASSSSSTGPASENSESSHQGFTAFGFGVGMASGLGVAALVAVLYCCCKTKRNPYSINTGGRNALLDDEV